MSIDSKFPLDPTPRSADQVIAELLRETEKLRRQVADAQGERDQFKTLYLAEAVGNDPKLTAEDIATAVPARPVFEELMRRLERR